MKYFVLIILLLSLWFFAGSFITETKNQATYGLTQVLLWPKWLVQGIFSPAVDFKNMKDLELENENLKAKIFELEQNMPDTEISDYIVAKIYSRSPFNNKNLLSINKGYRDGVAKDMVATVGGNILLGQVEDVFEKYSLVKTIFTNDWKLPVRISSEGVEALLVGGSELKLSMIAEDTEAENSQTVFIASKDFPYGMKIGELINLKQEASATVFKEASVQVPYNFNELTELWLIKSF
ncbi:MAG: rod shape-determining protein MreC [Patescibacteria group bacterium]